MATRAWATAVCGGWMLAASCTRDNPAFLDTEDPPGATAGSIDDGRTDGPTGPSATGMSTTGASATGASATATPETSIDATSLGTGGPSGDLDTTPADTIEPSTGGSSGGSTECGVHEPDPIEIHMLTLDSAVELPPFACNDLIVLPASGPLTVEEGDILHTNCGSCVCTGNFGTRLSFADTLTPPPLPDCGRLVIWAGPAPDGGCRWEGFAVLDETADDVPAFVAANSRNLPEAAFGSVEVSLQPDETCQNPNACPELPGRHGLVFANGVPVFVGAPLDVMIGFSTATPYTVTNRMSFVEPECAEQIAWEALEAS